MHIPRIWVIDQSICAHQYYAYCFSCIGLLNEQVATSAHRLIQFFVYSVPIMRELHFGPQMATYSAARHLINEIIESFKDDFPKYYSVLKFTYQNPETAHLLVKEKADLYSRLTGCGEKTYRYTLHDSIIEFAKALWGPLPDINKTDIFAVEDGHIDFVRHITTELFDY